MPRSVEARYPPDKWDYIPDVPIFRTHDLPKGGRRVTVTKDTLQKIADTHNWMWEALGTAAPFSEGHTLDTGPDGAEVPETEQPPVCGVGVNFRVGEVPTDPENSYLFCTWAVPKDQKERLLREYVSISPEFYPARSWVWPISLLRSNAPELAMPPIPMKYGADLDHYSLTLPLHYSQEPPMPSNCDDKKDMKKDDEKKYQKDGDKKVEYADKDDDKAKKDDKSKESPEMEKAQSAVSKGSVEDGSKLDQMMAMMEQFAQYIPLLQQLQGMMDEEGEGDDLLDKADDKGDEGDKEPPMPKAAEKDSAKNFENPVRFDAGMGSATNGYTPSFTKEKDSYMTADDVVKYKKELDAVKARAAEAEAKLAAYQKITDDLYRKTRKADAEKIVYALETEHNIDFSDSKVRQEEIDTIARLDEKVVPEFVERAKVRYQKRLPNAAGVREVAKYAATPEPETPSLTPDQVWEKAMAEIKKRHEEQNKK